MRGSPRQLSRLRQARIHPHDEPTPQKSISRQLGSRPFKNYFGNCGIVAIGLTVDAHAMDSLIDDDCFRCQSLRQIQGAKKCDPQFGPSIY
jgi:hypothetical protein